MKVLKVAFGGILGLMVGAALGSLVMGWWLTRNLPPPPPTGEAVVWLLILVLRNPVSAAAVLFCALAFAFLFSYLFNRIGHGKRPVQV